MGGNSFLSNRSLTWIVDWWIFREDHQLKTLLLCAFIENFHLQHFLRASNLAVIMRSHAIQPPIPISISTNNRLLFFRLALSWASSKHHNFWDYCRLCCFPGHATRFQLLMEPQALIRWPECRSEAFKRKRKQSGCWDFPALLKWILCHF
jgi:hypothetical protein